MFRPCPLCGSNKDTAKCIYLGLPMWVCDSAAHQHGAGHGAHVFGFWSWVFYALPITGEDGAFKFMVYIGISYPEALWHWLAGDAEEEDG